MLVSVSKKVSRCLPSPKTCRSADHELVSFRTSSSSSRSQTHSIIAPSQLGTIMTQQLQLRLTMQTSLLHITWQPPSPLTKSERRPMAVKTPQSSGMKEASLMEVALSSTVNQDLISSLSSLCQRLTGHSPTMEERRRSR